MHKMIMMIFILSSLYAPYILDLNIDDHYEEIWQGILNVENNDNHYNRKGNIALSHKGAVGKAQLMSNTFLWVINKSKSYHLELSDITNESVNEWAGEWYFHHLFYDKHPYDYKRAISSYNCGGDSAKFMTNYVSKVIKELK